MIETVPRQPTLATKLRSTMADMPSRVPAGIERVRRALKAGGLAAAGPAYTRYLEHDEATGIFELEVGIPVWSGISGYGDLFPSALPGGRVKRVEHVGPHATLGESFAKLTDLLVAEDLVPMGPAWESYVIGPETEPDASRWRTVIYQPI